MSSLCQALADYLRVRRRLGFEMPQDGRLLEGFVAFLEHAGAERITTELASPGRGSPSTRTRTAGVNGCRSHAGSRGISRRSTLPARFQAATCCRARANAWRRTSSPAARSSR
jgi:hypothetical protein